MIYCDECGRLLIHDIDCSRHPMADKSGLYIYRIEDVEALKAACIAGRVYFDTLKGAWASSLDGCSIVENGQVMEGIGEALDDAFDEWVRLTDIAIPYDTQMEEK